MKGSIDLENKNIEKIEIIKVNYKNRLYINIKYNDGTFITKKLNKKDKESLFIALTNIMILNKYR